MNKLLLLSSLFFMLLYLSLGHSKRRIKTTVVVRYDNVYDSIYDYDTIYLEITNKVRAKFGKEPYLPNDISFN